MQAEAWTVLPVHDASSVRNWTEAIHVTVRKYSSAFSPCPESQSGAEFKNNGLVNWRRSSSRLALGCGADIDGWF